MTLHIQPLEQGCKIIPFSVLLDRRRTKDLRQKKATQGKTATPCILYPNPNGITVEDIMVDVIRF